MLTKKENDAVVDALIDALFNNKKLIIEKGIEIYISEEEVRIRKTDD